MARVKEIDLQRRHQMAVCRAARKELWKRAGGLLLADGVGLGKTYEALGTVASLLAQKQHGKVRLQKKSFRVLCLVPPSLVTKWADEMLLEDKFRRHLEAWNRRHAHAAVYRTFIDVVVVRRMADLQDRRGELRYGQHELPGGFYIVNSNLLYREGRKVTQLHRTGWDAIIIDEAHHINGDKLLRHSHRQILADPKTATLLLTATPFQLSPQELKDLFALTFGGYGSSDRKDDPFTKAEELYAAPAFREYRRSLAAFFRSGSAAEAKAAQRLRSQVEGILRPRMLRNQKVENRRYHFVDSVGQRTPLAESPFKMDTTKLRSALSAGGTICLTNREALCYVQARDRIVSGFSQGKQTFVAGALRQLLSTWSQYRQSTSGRVAKVSLPRGDHPKTSACVKLVSQLIRDEVRRRTADGLIGKVLIFTSYVGADRRDDAPNDEKSYGTAATLKDALMSELRRTYHRSSRSERHRRLAALLSVIRAAGDALTEEEEGSLRTVIRRFAGSVPARLLLRNEGELRKECGALRKLLRSVPDEEEEFESEEEERRWRDRRERLVKQIEDRYATRDLVARYDGATDPEARDRHLRGFNSPFAPLVLIASSVGQEGIDLQRYCRHVVHYDLEWNPAKVEQREGRVDRQGRATTEPVNVYFLICGGTYDERIMHAMVNRFRWHQVLLASRSALEAAPGKNKEAESDPNWMKRLTLDLAPKRIAG